MQKSALHILLSLPGSLSLFAVGLLTAHYLHGHGECPFCKVSVHVLLKARHGEEQGTSAITLMVSSSPRDAFIHN